MMRKGHLDSCSNHFSKTALEQKPCKYAPQVCGVSTPVRPKAASGDGIRIFEAIAIHLLNSLLQIIHIDPTSILHPDSGPPRLHPTQLDFTGRRNAKRLKVVGVVASPRPAEQRGRAAQQRRIALGEAVEETPNVLLVFSLPGVVENVELLS